jgi:hypothetical protein
MAYTRQKIQPFSPNKPNKILLGSVTIEVSRAATNLMRLDDPSTPQDERKRLREWFRCRFLKQPIAFRRQAFMWVRMRRYQVGD